MGVQAIATSRNSSVEFVVHYILESFAEGLKQRGLLTTYRLEQQAPFSSDIARDIWDHKLDATGSDGRLVQIWCQTTCYKGNARRRPEPNKTYEVRETLVEGLSIRQCFPINPLSDYRTVHFTVGDANYTYGWFLDLKSATYDKSIYIGGDHQDIFGEIAATLNGAYTEKDKSARLSACVANKTRLGNHICDAISELNRWWVDENLSKSVLADEQSRLVAQGIAKAQSSGTNLNAIRGSDIKGRVNTLIFAKDTTETDPLILETAVKVMDKNPFLQCALDITIHWDRFIEELRQIAANSRDLDDLITRLWNRPEPERLVLRRLLLRIHTDDSVAYVQDLDIPDITEHNLYAGEHTSATVRSVCSRLSKNMRAAGFQSKDELVQRVEAVGKRLVNQARWFEAKNGTAVTPSFDYVNAALGKEGYKVVTPSEAKIRAIGYHSKLTGATVKPYNNLKAVLNADGQVVCLLKAKFYRLQEFSRRCKEEAFVGLTLKYKRTGTDFTERFPFPLIMFIDMSEGCVPPDHAVKRLQSFGWEVVFSVESLISKLVEKTTVHQHAQAH